MAVKTKKRPLPAARAPHRAHPPFSIIEKLQSMRRSKEAARSTHQAPRRSNGQSRPTTDLASALAEQDMADELLQQADPSDVKRLCEQYGLRRGDLGRMTGFSLRALADWSAGKLPSEPAKRRLHEIRRLLDSLARVVKPEAISPWLKERNRAFENMTPIQVIEVGEIDRLWQMVHHMSSDSVD